METSLKEVEREVPMVKEKPYSRLIACKSYENGAWGVGMYFKCLAVGAATVSPAAAVVCIVASEVLP
jgi:hypothetical protein